MIIAVGDKVSLKKKYNRLQFIGEIYEIASINDTNIVIRDNKTKVAVAAITLDEFNDYFETIDKVFNWSKWCGLGILDTEIPMSFVEFRVRGTKYVEVRVQYKNGQKDYITKRATFNKKYDDNFDLNTGIKLALSRCIIEIYGYELQKIEDRTKFVQESIEKVEKNIKKITE